MFSRDDVSRFLPGGTSSGYLFYPGGTGDLDLFKDGPKVTQLVWDGKKGMSAVSRVTHGLHHSCPCRSLNKAMTWNDREKASWLLRLLLSQPSLSPGLLGKSHLARHRLCLGAVCTQARVDGPISVVLAGFSFIEIAKAGHGEKDCITVPERRGHTTPHHTTQSHLGKAQRRSGGRCGSEGNTWARPSAGLSAENARHT